MGDLERAACVRLRNNNASGKSSKEETTLKLIAGKHPFGLTWGVACLQYIQKRMFLLKNWHV